MASYTVRVGGTGNKDASVDGDPTVVGECMPLATALGESYSPGDVLLFADTGGEYPATLTTPSAGEAGTYFYQQAYPGHTPIFNGSDITTGWEAHATLPLVWQKTSITKEPSMIWFDDVRGTKKDNAAVLDTQMDWCWVADVAYVYSATDPDAAYTKVELAARQYCLTNNATPYVITDGLEFKHANWLSVYVTNGSNFSEFYNCHAHDSMVGFKCGDNDCVFDSCVSEDHTGDAFGGSGDVNNPFYRLTITGCTARRCLYTLGVNGGSASGIKAFNMNDSLITKSEWDSNASGGIRLDGGRLDSYGNPFRWGCNDNIVSENLIHDNGGAGGIDGDPDQIDQVMLEFSDRNTIKFNLVYDCFAGGYNIGLSYQEADCLVFGNITWGASGTSVGSIRTYFGSSIEGYPNYFVGNVIDQSYFGFSLNGAGYDILRNNIITRSTFYALRFGSAAVAANVDSDYNCFYQTPEHVVNVVSDQPYTFSEWQEAGQDVNSIDSDPLFTDPDNRDYTLQAGSPCIGAGDKSLGEPFNEALHPSSDLDTLGGMIIVDRDDY